MKEISFFELIRYPFFDMYSLHWRNKNGVLHRNKKPAAYDYDDEHKIISAIWCRHGDYNRLYGPAKITFDEYNHILELDWCIINNDFSDAIINEWVKENNITLKHDNDYKIPVEYRAEFKLRFH